MSDRSEESVRRFLKGYNCAQSAFSVFAPELGMSERDVVRIAAGFGGGLGRRGEACGAVTGAIMALSLRYSGEHPEVLSQRQAAYDKAAEVVKAFIDRHGTCRCRDLLGYNLSDLEELKRAREDRAFQKICTMYIREAVELVERLLQ
ncbi:MAG: C-GCAxxG-C-C family protein [Chloroflexota bacterium]